MKLFHIVAADCCSNRVIDVYSLVGWHHHGELYLVDLTDQIGFNASPLPWFSRLFFGSVEVTPDIGRRLLTGEVCARFIPGTLELTCPGSRQAARILVMPYRPVNCADETDDIRSTVYPLAAIEDEALSPPLPWLTKKVVSRKLQAPQPMRYEIWRFCRNLMRRVDAKQPMIHYAHSGDGFCYVKQRHELIFPIGQGAQRDGTLIFAWPGESYVLGGGDLTIDTLIIAPN